MKKIITAMLLFTSVAFANDTKELVSPYAPGGVVSSFGRVVQRHMIEDLNLNVALINKPGADARIGVKYVTGRPADGNTWIVAATGPFLFNQVVYADPGYRAADFDLVVPMAQSPSILAVSNQSGISSFTEFIKHARTKPVNCGVSNSGALFLTRYLVTELKLTRVEIVNFKGASEVSTALMNGTIECSVDTLQSQLKYHQDNRLKIVAVSSTAKSDAVPSAALFSDVLPGFSFYSWYGVGVNKNTPLRDKALILTAMRNINSNENYRNSIKSLGLELGNPAEDSQVFIQREYKRFDRIRMQAGIEKIIN
jgi:tripartite-type tricarboxylate transporter receptor subunit TctC